MNTNALSVANYFIDLANADNKPLRLLGLVKRVYIAHGFSLALADRGLLDGRFDHVEAWKYGPVIPSVYHSFKQYKAAPIQEKTVVMEFDENGEPIFPTPTLKDKDAIDVCKMVWSRYKSFTDSDLVSLTHMTGTPWQLCYMKGENSEIPDELTKAYYRRVVALAMERHGKR